MEQSRYLIAPFEAIQDETVREVHNCGAIQTGKSLIADIAMPWIMVNDPGAIMWTFQTEEDAKEHLLTRCWALWDACRALRPLWPADRHKKTQTEVYFGPFFFIANGANLSSLQSKSIRWKFNSELWLPQWQDLYKQAAGRVSAFERVGQSKIVNDSQSGNVGDVMDKNLRGGSFERWSCACPACRKVYPLRVSQQRGDKSYFGMTWAADVKKPDGTYNVNRAVETVRWTCACGHELPDDPRTRRRWNDEGQYVSENPSAPPSVKSFWWSAVHVQSLATLAKEKAEALNVARYGDMSDLKTFKQQRENESWEETHLAISLSSNGADYVYADFADGQKWALEQSRCMSMDRQQGEAGDIPHRWIEIRAWAPGGASRQLFFGRVNTAEEVREMQMRFKVPDRHVWQDMNFDRHGVFEECVRYGWLAVGSANRSTWKITMKLPDGKTVEVTLPYSPIAATAVSGQLAHYLNFNEDYFADFLASLVSGAGVAWESPKDCSLEYEAHLKAEHKVEKRPGVYKWEKLHSTKPNHGWDTSKIQVLFGCVKKLLVMPKLPDIPETKTEAA